MIIEFTGCSGSGKTTMADHLVDKLRSDGCIVRLGSGKRSRQSGNQTLDNIRWDLRSHRILKKSHREYRDYLKYSFLRMRAQSSTPFMKLIIMRSIVRKALVYHSLRNGCNDGEYGIIDEGTIHAAHVLFTNPMAYYNRDDLTAFVGVAPLPDVIVHVVAKTETIVERTMRRKDPPWRFKEKSDVIAFVSKTQTMYHELMSDPKLSSRMICINGDSECECEVERLYKVVRDMQKKGAAAQ